MTFQASIVVGRTSRTPKATTCRVGLPFSVADATLCYTCLRWGLRLAIRRRDVFVPDALHWGDPRRLLVDKTAWKHTGASVKRGLDLDGGPRRLLATSEPRTRRRIHPRRGGRHRRTQPARCRPNSRTVRGSASGRRAAARQHRAAARPDRRPDPHFGIARSVARGRRLDRVHPGAPASDRDRSIG